MTLVLRPMVKVLIVDDDEEDFILARDLLAEARDTRYAVEWASTYEDAMLAIDRRVHDVYLLDYRLGERTGLELLREAIASGCRAPLILLTGQGDRDVDIAAMESGAADYLSKGQVDSQILERSIRYAIERSRMNRLKDQMIGFVSHEIRNPLGAILGYASLLRDSVPGQTELERDEAAQAITEAAQRLCRVANGFLDISRIEAGKQLELVTSRFAVRPMVEEAIAIARGGARRCTFAARYGEGVDEVVADRDKLIQVLLNLCTNADKYSPDGGEVDVSVEREGEMLVFAVTDHGLGIADSALADLFTPFYRAPAVERANIRGTGLGLHLCQHLVAAHGGTINVRTREGEGSTFYFSVPVAPQ
jgi:signal transduction histidine kinase